MLVSTGFSGIASITQYFASLLAGSTDVMPCKAWWKWTEMGCQRPKPLAFTRVTRRNLKNYENIETQADKSDNFCMDASKAARLKEVAEMGTDAIHVKSRRI